MVVAEMKITSKIKTDNSIDLASLRYAEADAPPTLYAGIGANL